MGGGLYNETLEKNRITYIITVEEECGEGGKKYTASFCFGQLCDKIPIIVPNYTGFEFMILMCVVDCLVGLGG